LAREAQSEMGTPVGVEERERAIAAIERTMDRRRVRSQRIRWAGTYAAAAALVVISAGISAGVSRLRSQRSLALMASAPPVNPHDDLRIVGHPQGAGARVLGAAGESDLSDGWALQPGSRVITPATGRASLTFSTGTTVALGEGADMTVVSQGASERLRLDRGAIDLKVAKQAPDRRFFVATQDAEVEVRGTQFRVSIVPSDRACGDGTPTRVVVTEGVVVVRARGTEARVAAGDRWPSGCVHEVATTANPGASSLPLANRGPRGLPGALAVGTSGAVSSLTDQNDLFAEALTAKRQGDVWGAVGAFERLNARFPGSPLAESAAVERLRLLRDASPSRARVAAQQYIARYPSGYARAEADAIVASSP
jgi:hypothetical protein